jgi:hypothetical protein
MEVVILVAASGLLAFLLSLGVLSLVRSYLMG